MHAPLCEPRLLRWVAFDNITESWWYASRGDVAHYDGQSWVSFAHGGVRVGRRGAIDFGGLPVEERPPGWECMYALLCSETVYTRQQYTVLPRGAMDHVIMSTDDLLVGNLTQDGSVRHRTK